MLSTEKCNIPLNDYSFYSIIPGTQNWESSVDFLFDEFDYFYYINIFMIFRSYIAEDSINITNVWLVVSNVDEMGYTYRKLDFDIIFRSNYNQFVMYLSSVFNNDKEYITTKKFCGFKICLNKISHIVKNKKWYPIYPWKINTVKSFMDRSNYTELTNFDFKIDEKYIESVNENKKLRKENYRLRNKIRGGLIRKIIR